MRRILPLGFESIQPFFWQTLGDKDLPRLARELREAIGDADVTIARSACSAIRWRRASSTAKTLAGWESLIDNAHLFGADGRGFTGRIRGKPLEASLPRFGEVWGELGEARRRQGRAHRLRELRDGRQLGERRLEHRPQSRRLGADVQRTARRQSRPRMGALPPAGLSDRSDPADPQMGGEIFHVHGKDATVRWDVIREHGVFGKLPFVQMRTPGFGDSDWTRIISELRLAGFTGSIDIEGWHDPVYRDEPRNDRTGPGARIISRNAAAARAIVPDRGADERHSGNDAIETEQQRRAVKRWDLRGRAQSPGPRRNGGASQDAACAMTDTETIDEFGTNPREAIAIEVIMDARSRGRPRSPSRSRPSWRAARADPGCATSGARNVHIRFFVGGAEGDAFGTIVYNGAKQAAATPARQVDYVFSGWDDEKMMQQLREAVAAKPDGIAMMGHPGDAAIMPLAEQASKAGIKMMYQNVPVPQAVAKFGGGYVGAQQAPQGQALGAEAVSSPASSLGGRSAIMIGPFNDGTAARAKRGTAKALEEAGVKVITPRQRSRNGPPIRTSAIPVITAALPGRTRPPRRSAIRAASMLGNAPTYMQAAGKKPGEIFNYRLRHQPADRRGVQGRLGAADRRSAAVPCRATCRSSASASRSSTASRRSTSTPAPAS